MKRSIISFFLLSILSLSAFEVQFTKVYSKYYVPNKDAVAVCTKKENLSFPFKYIRQNNCYILLADPDKINMWLDNEFYAPEDATFKELKIAKINYDKIQYKIIQQVKKNYKKCKIKQIIFISPDQDKIITKPQTIEVKYKIILNCK